MSNLGKIFLYIAVAGAVAALVAGGLLIKQRWIDASNLADATQAKVVAEKAAAQQKKAAEAAESDKEDAEKKLTDATSQISDLNTKLSDAQKEADDAKAAADKANAAVTDTQAKLDDLNKQLGGQSVQDLKDAVTKAQSDLQAAQSEQKIMADNLQSAQQQVKQYADALSRAENGGKMPPGIAGKVTFVDHTWNFVVLNVGVTDGVVPNGELIVYHGRDFLGKIRVTKADANDSVAEILPDIKGDIQIGDSVLN